MQPNLALVAALALALTAPAVAAEYYAFGEVEPNTQFDADAYNHYAIDNDPNPAIKQVYFNAFITFSLTTVNPNLGASDSSVLTPANFNFEAMLGVWKDCNGDNYVGSAESGLIEYRAEVLEALGSKICPADTSAHNQNGWVTELIHIGMEDPCQFATPDERDNQTEHPCYDYVFEFKVNPRVIYSNGTKIWADAAAPGELVGSSSCPLGILPNGTTANTGMALRYADCFIGFKVAKTINTVDGATGLGIGFADPKNPQNSDSPLVQNLPVHPWENSFDNDHVGLLQYESGKPAFEVWDCEAERITVADPTHGKLQDFGVKAPAGDLLNATEKLILGPPEPGDNHTLVDANGNLLFTFDLADGQGNVISQAPIGPKVGFDPSNVDPNDPHQSTNWSVYDATLQAYDGAADDCDPATRSIVSSFVDDLSPEAPNEPTSNIRTESDLTMEFDDGHRGFYGSTFGIVSPEADKEIGTDDAPGDGGLTATRDLFGPTWWSPGYASAGQTVNRNTGEPSSRVYFTWYVQLNTTDLQARDLLLPTQGEFTYGADYCGTIGENAQNVTDDNLNGFACDPAYWYKDTAGKDSMPRYDDKITPKGAYPGEKFHARDVDCYDGRLFAGLYASLTPLSPKGTCASEVKTVQ